MQTCRQLKQREHQDTEAERRKRLPVAWRQRVQEPLAAHRGGAHRRGRGRGPSVGVGALPRGRVAWRALHNRGGWTCTAHLQHMHASTGVLHCPRAKRSNILLSHNPHGHTAASGSAELWVLRTCLIGHKLAKMHARRGSRMTPHIYIFCLYFSPDLV